MHTLIFPESESFLIIHCETEVAESDNEGGRWSAWTKNHNNCIEKIYASSKGKNYLQPYLRATLPTRIGAKKPPTLFEAVQTPHTVPLSWSDHQVVMILAHAGAPNPFKGDTLIQGVCPSILIGRPWRPHKHYEVLIYQWPWYYSVAS